MSDLLHQDLNVAQSDKQPYPPTLASAATIAPQNRFNFVSGTTAIATITPATSGYHEVVLCFTNAVPAAFLTTGNILTAYAPAQNRPVTLYYDPATGKYYVMAVA